MSDEQYLQRHLNVIERYLRSAIADIVRAKPAEPLAGLIESLVRQKPETPLAPPLCLAAAKKGTWTAAEWISSPEVSAILAAALLPQPVADELEAVRDLGKLGGTELHSTLRARLVMGSDALASLLAPKISALTTADAASGEELHSKFSEQGAFTLKHLDLNAFFAGLERVIGAPSPGSMEDVLDAMHAEHLKGSESEDLFQTANYGVLTNSATEWRFVVTPGAPPNGGWPFETKNTSIEDDAPGAPAGEHRCIKRVTMPLDELRQRVRARNERLKKISEPELVEAEVLAARAYTGPLFYKYNAILRGLDTESYTAPPLLKNAMVRLCCPKATHDAYIGTAAEAPWKEANGKLSYADALQTLNKYTTTLHCINSAIVKVGKLTHACVVYRGVSGGKLPESFWLPDEFGCCGGVEPGFMSTTQSLAVATGYASGQLAKAGMVIESVLGMTNRGADIGWLSQYPHEREILMGPLTCLEVDGTRAEGSLLVVKTKLSVNLTSPTIERVIGKMKDSHLDLLRILHTKLAKVSPTAAHKLHGLEEEAAKLSVDFYNGAEAYKERTNLALDVKGRLEFEEQDARLRSVAKFEFVFGNLKQLYGNLSSVLPPPPDGASDEQLRRLMQAEHCQGPDHNVAFTALSPESGGTLHTSSEIEWYYVVEPTVERLVTLSLAPSIGGAWDDAVTLGGAAGSGGPQLGAMMPLTAWPSEVQHPPYSTGEATAERPGGAGAPPRPFQPPRPLSDFAEECRARNIQLAELGLPPLLTAELIGMRLYTGVMGKSVYNVALRALCGLPGWFNKVFEGRLQRNPYATTLHCVNRGLLKLGKVRCLEPRTR